MGNKLEPFDEKRTRLEGLWYNRQLHRYSSRVINLSELKDFKGNVRLMVMKNHFYNNGKNGRPNYLFSIIDSKALDSAKTLETEDLCGQWIYGEYMEYFTIVQYVECSKCGTMQNPDSAIHFNYCPQCGARMRTFRR